MRNEVVRLDKNYGPELTLKYVSNIIHKHLVSRDKEIELREVSFL